LNLRRRGRRLLSFVWGERGGEKKERQKPRGEKKSTGERGALPSSARGGEKKKSDLWIIPSEDRRGEVRASLFYESKKGRSNIPERPFFI